MKHGYIHFVNVLDRICTEAPLSHQKYHPSSENIEEVNYARSRAFIHLFLMSRFGLTSFQDRENHVTDGTGDAGIDGYFIDPDKKEIYFIQSKFRTTGKGFEEKEIRFEEILSMDVDRVLNGEHSAENGSKYNGKILSLIKEIQSIDDIGRYNYRVVILANIRDVGRKRLQRLTGGFAAEVYNFERCYKEIVFLVLAGTYYDSENLFIHLNLSNKQSGSKISYSVDTQAGPVEITVVFVPTIEIASTMADYRNGILKYNPRCFLEFSESNINTEIAESILKLETNEFSLFNNGITMLSDDTSINEKIGYRDKAQLVLRNPQILNGGQTAFALCRILEDDPAKAESLFSGKEVLLRVITMNSESISPKRKIDLIEAISNATNKQNEVTHADRHSNDRIQLDIQEALYRDYGILYERKRGEFADALRLGYISNRDILTRSQLLRISRTIAGDLSRKQSGKKYFNNTQNYDRFFRIDDVPKYYLGHFILTRLREVQTNPAKRHRGSARALSQGIYLILFAVFRYVAKQKIQSEEKIVNIVQLFLSRWIDFERSAISSETNKKYIRSRVDRVTRETTLVFNYKKYYQSKNVVQDLQDFFQHEA